MSAEFAARAPQNPKGKAHDTYSHLDQWGQGLTLCGRRISGYESVLVEQTAREDRCRVCYPLLPDGQEATRNSITGFHNRPSPSSPGSQACRWNTDVEQPGTPDAIDRSNGPGEKRVGGSVPGHLPPHPPGGGADA